MMLVWLTDSCLLCTYSARLAPLMRADSPPPSFAVDVVKTRIQASEAYFPLALTAPASGLTSVMIESPVPSPYRTIRSAAVHSYREEGWGVFVRGLGPTLLRSVPVNMVSRVSAAGCVHSGQREEC